MILLGMILHVTFLTSDLEKARAFYEGILDLKPDPKRPKMSFDGVWYDVAVNQQIHLMALPNPEQGLKRAEHGGRDRHVALAVADVVAIAALLEIHQIPYTMSQSGRVALFCRDPDQNALEFIQI